MIGTEIIEPRRLISTVTPSPESLNIAGAIPATRSVQIHQRYWTLSAESRPD